MADIVDKATRSRMMASIKGKNTRPEVFVRKALHAAGFRFRLHVKDLPGKPDIVLPKYNAVVFVHGCFWHGHECRNFKWPMTRKRFWMSKILGNKARDKMTTRKLVKSGWRVIAVWECELQKTPKVEGMDFLRPAFAQLFTKLKLGRQAERKAKCQ